MNVVRCGIEGMTTPWAGQFWTPNTGRRILYIFCSIVKRNRKKKHTHNFFHFAGVCTAKEGPVRIKINVWFPFMYSPKGNCAASLFLKQNYNVLFINSYTHMSVRDLYTVFPGSVCLFCCSQICGAILEIYKLLTDT